MKILNEAKIYIADPIIYLKSGDCYKAQNNFVEAEKNYLYAGAMIPARIYPKYLLALLYAEQGKTDEALKIAKIVLEFNEKIKSPAVDEMKDHMRNFINGNIIQNEE